MKEVENVGNLRRAKDISTRSNRNAAKLVLSEYPDWQQQAPVYITYYQVNDLSSTQNDDLETTHSLLGDNTPIKYNKINDVPFYGVDTLEIANDIGERGLVSNINGNGFFLPGTIEPRGGEFFAFDVEGLEDHMFQITDVQQSHATSRKYFQVNYTLYHENTDAITSNVLDDYEMIYDNDETSADTVSTVVKKTSAVRVEKLKDLVDEIIKDYTKDYFDDEVNYFVYRTEIENQPVYLWNSYLQHFIVNNNVTSYYNKKLMTDIYILDVDNFYNKNIYSEKTYRKSIFKSVEVQNNCCEFETSLFQVIDNKLRTRNLPFFCSTGPYKLLDINNREPANSLYMWPIICGSESKVYGRRSKYESFENFDELDGEYELHLKPRDILWQTVAGQEYPIEVYYIPEDGNVISANLKEVLDSSDKYFEDDDENLMFSIVKSYINDSLSIDDDLMTKLNKFYYENNAKNYILVPLVIYILKQKISEILNT